MCNVLLACEIANLIAKRSTLQALCGCSPSPCSELILRQGRNTSGSNICVCPVWSSPQGRRLPLIKCNMNDAHVADKRAPVSTERRIMPLPTMQEDETTRLATSTLGFTELHVWHLKTCAHAVVDLPTLEKLTYGPSEQILVKSDIFIVSK